jgi:hypothetical protein
VTRSTYNSGSAKTQRRRLLGRDGGEPKPNKMYAIIDGATPSVLLIEKLYEVKPLICFNADAKVCRTRGILNTQYYQLLIVSNPFRGDPI